MKNQERITINKTVKDINNNQKLFIASRESFPIIHIRGVGKFCARPDCNKMIKGKTIRYVLNGKEIVSFRKPLKNQIYCTSYCRQLTMIRNYNKKNRKLYTVRASIRLKVIDEKKPYREIIIYGGKHVKKIFKIEQSQKEIWEFLEALSRYKFDNPLSKEILTNYNNNNNDITNINESKIEIAR